MQYNCQKSSNFQGLSHFSRIFGKNDKIPGFFQAGKTVTIFPGFPGAVGTLLKVGKNVCLRHILHFKMCYFILKMCHNYFQHSFVNVLLE